MPSVHGIALSTGVEEVYPRIFCIPKQVSLLLLEPILRLSTVFFYYWGVFSCEASYKNDCNICMTFLLLICTRRVHADVCFCNHEKIKFFFVHKECCNYIMS